MKLETPRGPDRGGPRTKYEMMSSAELREERAKIEAGIQQATVFSEEQCREIERKIDKMVTIADRNKYMQHTVDRTPLRWMLVFVLVILV